MTNFLPSLSGFSSTITLDEEAVNLEPQLLDADVTFTDTDDNFDGGTLAIRGLLAQDILSVRDQGTAAGQIGYNGITLTFAGITIGTVTGGTSGADFNVTFNASATAASIEALVENLTYENLSDVPTTSRTLDLSISDDQGAVANQTLEFTKMNGAANPFNGITGNRSNPAIADIDTDGDLDLVIGGFDGTLRYFENTGTMLAPIFTQRTAAANPYNAIDSGAYSTPTHGDIDGDGDLDLVVGNSSGNLNYYENTGTFLTPTFTQRSGSANPFDGFHVQGSSVPVFADIDNDGDLDLVLGEQNGTVVFYENTGTVLLPTYTLRTGAADPFDGIDIGGQSAPVFIDIERDGDLDLVIGNVIGTLDYYENTGTELMPTFTSRTGAANPFDGIDIGFVSRPVIADVDNDADLDLVIGDHDGIISYYENTSSGIGFELNVTLHTDPSSGDDVMNGAAADDTIDGLEGNDTIRGHGGNDSLTGGKGNDTIDGGADNDMLIGNKGDDEITGGTGDDDLFGNRGIDFLDPGSGQDDLDGGSGFDRVSYANSAAGVTVNLDTGIGSGGDAAGDTYVRVEYVSGSAFDDTITGTAVGNLLDGHDGADTIFGLGGRDVISGNNGDDILHGGDKNDNLFGGSDNDQLFGDAGFDILYGELGNDEMTGGTDDDFFVFDSSHGAFGLDLIFDFENGLDKIDVREVFSIANPMNIADDFSDFTVSVSAAYGVKIKLEAGQVIYLDDTANGITVADIDASDFIFA